MEGQDRRGVSGGWHGGDADISGGTGGVQRSRQRRLQEPTGDDWAFLRLGGGDGGSGGGGDAGGGGAVRGHPRGA